MWHSEKSCIAKFEIVYFVYRVMMHVPKRDYYVNSKVIININVVVNINIIKMNVKLPRNNVIPCCSVIDEVERVPGTV